MPHESVRDAGEFPRDGLLVFDSAVSWQAVIHQVNVAKSV